MVNIICRGKYLALINIINLNCFQDLRFYKMSDTTFRHNRNGDCLLNSFDHFGVAHPGNTACCTNICRNPLQRHNRTGTCLLCDFCLFRSGNVHDHSTF